MEKIRHVFLVGRKWRLIMSSSSSSSCSSNTNTNHVCFKPLTTKASNRAAVHGVKAPVPDILDKEEVQKEIQKAKEDKEAKRKQIEKTIESHISKYKCYSESDPSSAH